MIFPAVMLCHVSILHIGSIVIRAMLRVLDLLQIYSGGSVSGAALMNEEKTDICINWAGQNPASNPAVHVCIASGMDILYVMKVCQMLCNRMD